MERPEVEFVILADHAEAVNGKLYLMGGGWDRRTVADFRQPQTFAVAAAVLIPAGDTNRQLTLSVTLTDAAGNDLVPPLLTQFNGHPFNPNQGQPSRYMLAANLQIILSRPGQYVVEASVESGSARRVTFVAESGLHSTGDGGVLH